MNTTANSDRIRAAARRLRAAALAGAFALAAIALAAALARPASGPVAAVLDAGGLPRAWATAIALLVAGLTVAALLSLARMLGQVAAGTFFAAAATAHFRRFAGWLLLAAAVQIVLPLAATAWLAFNAGAPGAALGIDVGDVLLLFLATLLFFVARLFDEAARLDEDNRSIV